jgi:hypothetical protein
MVVRRVLTDMGAYALLPITTGPLRPSTEAHLARELKRVRRRLARETIFVERRREDGSPAMARPCSACKNMLLRVGVGRVCYSTPDGPRTEPVYSIVTTDTTTTKRYGLPAHRCRATPSTNAKFAIHNWTRGSTPQGLPGQAQ